jgi:hypothetical protein
MNQLTLFPTEQQDHQHTIIEDREPWSGWKPDEFTRHCGECWQWLDDDGNAPAIST